MKRRAASRSPSARDRFVQDFPLQPGANQIVVVAVDAAGLTRVRDASPSSGGCASTKRRWFLPSALASALSLVGLGWGTQRLRRRRALRQRFNPYIAGAPVLDEQMFYGRTKLTQRMLSTLHRNSLMITGERRIGKTTFLHHLKRVLAEDEAGEWKFFPVFVDLQGVPEQGFFHAMMAEVVDGLGDLRADPGSRCASAPGQEGYEARDFSHDLPLVLAELRTRTEKKVKLALLIDEVDVLNEYSESVNQRLRGIFMKSFSESLVAVMSGVAIRRRWKSEVSPWYNFFDEIEIPPFTREDAEALIREPVAGRLPLPARGGRAHPRAVLRCVPTSSRSTASTPWRACWRMGGAASPSQDVEAARAAVEIEGPAEAPATPTPAPAGPVRD